MASASGHELVLKDALLTVHAREACGFAGLCGFAARCALPLRQVEDVRFGVLGPWRLAARSVARRVSARYAVVLLLMESSMWRREFWFLLTLDARGVLACLAGKSPENPVPSRFVQKQHAQHDGAVS